jgi:hypothetical protein
MRRHKTGRECYRHRPLGESFLKLRKRPLVSNLAFVKVSIMTVVMDFSA